MKFSESWLREWVNPALSREQLGERLTMAGLEIEELVPVAEKFSGVVVAQVIHAEKHPAADHLHICQVDVGAAKPLSIVCAATNVKAGIKVPAALEGAVLPNNITIKISKIREVISQGMLCSARDLGFKEESEGLLELPPDAPLGKNLWEYLHLNDYVIDVSITPNRGDCLSIRGMAHEIAALTQSKLTTPLTISEIKSNSTDIFPVVITAKAECPRYVGRVIRQVKADAVTPIWMSERLRRGGVRSISPVVDVTNYVMLELGQPMHAFDLNQLTGDIDVRMAKQGETLRLLDSSEVTLDNKTLVIADKNNVLAIAGVMGGMDSGVTLLTTDIFLESAFFNAQCIARQGRHYGITSDSAYRFERGVDSILQRIAIERATQLLLDIVGGQPGPVIEVSEQKYLPQPAKINLREARVEKILGIKIPNSNIEAILQHLGFTVEKKSDGWAVTVPPRRSDITVEVDLIEEIIRLYGYDKLPLHNSMATLKINSLPENKLSTSRLRRTLIDLGYHEVITYSFIDNKLQTLFDPENQPKELVNPITSEMVVMRTNLWPGLVNTLLYNQNRQQSRVRLFEMGLRFLVRNNQPLQQNVLAGLVSGPAFPEQWGIANRPVDFFDIKGDLENLFNLTLAAETFTFAPGKHPALHPGQTAEIQRNSETVGVLGRLHPSVIQALDIQDNIYVFELLLDTLVSARVPKFKEISKFPEIRRDIAILIDQTIPAQAIRATIIEVAGELLQEVKLFDVYQGKGIPAGQKSVALGLTLQHSSRTLVDEEVTNLMQRIIVALKQRFTAELRG